MNEIPQQTTSERESLVTVEDGVAVVTLNRPDRLNALSHRLVDALTAEIHQLADNRTVRAIVLTGAGRAFSAGADLRGGPSDAEAVVREHYIPLINQIVSCPVPIVAAVNGVAAGAAVSIAAACDMRVAAETAGFQLSFSRIGLVPDAGATWLLPRLIGHGRAVEMALLAQRVDSQTALSWGLVNAVVAAEAVVTEAVSLAATLAERSSSIGPIKQLLAAGWNRALDEQLEDEALWQGELQHGPDYAEAKAAFLEKRTATFGERIVGLGTRA